MVNKRRRFFTIVPDEKKRKMQMRYMRLIVFTQLISIMIVVVGLNMIIGILWKTFSNQASTQVEINSAFIAVSCIFAVITILAIVVGAFASIHLSHKFVGPLYRIELMLKEMLKTDTIQQIQVRSDDDLQDLVVLLNEFIEKKIKGSAA